jgi:tetratricopeptide (TPR) repeat protein
MASHAIARLDEIEEIDDGRIPMRPVRHHLGIETFGITAATAPADGSPLINEHDETEHDSGEELYVVTVGHAEFEIDGQTYEAPAGTFVRVMPGTKRSAVAREAGTTVLAIGAGPEGVAYEVSNWEEFAPLFPLFESGDYEQGADRAEALLDNGKPHGAAVYFNTACFESQAGRIDAAIDNLRRALELAPAMAELARDDEDFAPLRDHPAFQSLISAS